MCSPLCIVVPKAKDPEIFTFFFKHSHFNALIFNTHMHTFIHITEPTAIALISLANYKVRKAE